MNSQSEIYFIHDISVDVLENVLLPLKQRFSQSGILVFLSEADKDRVGVIQGVCKANNIPLMGAIFPMLVKDDAFCETGAWIIGFREMPYFSLQESLPENFEEIEHRVRGITQKISAEIGDSEEAALYMIFDAMLLNISTILDFLYLNLANSVSYAGVNAGSESFKPMPCLFDSDKLVGNAVLLMLLKENKGAVLEHGYHMPERTVYATSADKNRIFQINWRPAFDVYQEFVQSQYGVDINRENFYQYSVHFPFGIKRASQQVVLRIPVSLEEDGTLFCIGEIPDNSVLTLLKSPSVDTNRTLQVLHDGLLNMYPNAQHDHLLLFYCGARRNFIGEELAVHELKEFKRVTGANTVAGALSLGEIGSSTLNEYPLFHHATLVAAHI